MSPGWSVSFAVMLLTIGCSPAPPATPGGSKSTESTATKPAATANEVSKGDQSDANPAEAPDLSLTEVKYIELGMPSAGHAWSGSEVSRAAKVLSEVAKRDASQLPRFGSTKSGKVFARITSDENLQSLGDKSLPVTVRLGYALQHLYSTTAISKLYAAAAAEKKTGSDEATEILGQTLRIADALKDLSDEIAPKVEKKDGMAAIAAKSLKEAKSALGPIVQTAITQTLASKTMKPETRERVLKHLDQSLPGLIKVLPPPVRTELLTQLKALSDKPEYAKHQKFLDPLLEKITKAIEDAPSNESDR